MTRGPSILFLTSARKGNPSTFFRVHQFLPRLREDGFRVRVAPCVPSKYASAPIRALRPLFGAAKLASRLVSLLRSPFHDLVVLERELLPRFTPLLERMTRRMNPRIHFDFDDAIHLLYARTDPNPVASVLRLSCGVTAGNAWLAEVARPFNDRVSVVPTSVDTDRFSPGTGGDVPLVWIGSSSNLPFLAQIAPAIRRVPAARLLVVCNRPPGDLGVEVDYVPWSETTEIEAIRRGRIGLMPLPDEPWSKGKCALKLIQYMACGLPTVSSPVGVNPEVVENGASGLLARSENDWVEAITRLLRDDALARCLSVRGRRRVEDAFSVRAVYPRLRSALRSSLS